MSTFSEENPFVGLPPERIDALFDNTCAQLNRIEFQLYMTPNKESPDYQAAKHEYKLLQQLAEKLVEAASS